MGSQLRGDHTSLEIRRDLLLLCQHSYTREPYAASQKESHDLQEEVRHVRALHGLRCYCF